MNDQTESQAPVRCQHGLAGICPSCELIAVAEERDRYQTALARITDCPAHRFPTPNLQARYIQNIAIEALDNHCTEPCARGSVKKRIRIRHHQMHLQKGPGNAISSVDVLVRMGDLVALMICAEYMKRYEDCRIVFQLMDKTHMALKAEVLFKGTIDEILTDEGTNCGLQNPELPEIYDPGPLWIASTFYHQRYGADVVPRLCLDPTHYQGPEMDWGNYVVFHPLFDPPYNKPRGMEESFVNEFCDRLHETLGERVLVITNQPDRIHSKIRMIATDNLYDLVYLIGKAKVYLGGDTGFTHFAAAGRVQHLFALYGRDYFCDFPTDFANICFDNLVNPFAAWGNYWGTGMDTRPKCDPTETTLHFHLLGENRLPADEMISIVQQVRTILSA
jgi:hypothetical protein